MAFGNRVTRWMYDHSPPPVQELVAGIYSRGRSQMKYGAKFYEYLTDLERTQWYNDDELQTLQDEKVRRLIWHAYRHVPYYQSLFDKLGIAPHQVGSRDDLVHLPYLEKDTVQKRSGDFRSSLYRDSRSVEHFQSSGTTGKALDIYVSRDCLQMEKAFSWLHRSWGGIRPGDRLAAFVGFPVVPVRRKRPPFWVYDRVEDRMIFSLQHMSKVNLPAYSDQLTRFQPLFISGYPTAIYLMALYLCDAGMTSVRPKAVFTASETLLPHQRPVIEQAFGCRLFDWYGAVELIANVVQCEHGSYHIKPEYGVVEILNPDGTPTIPGQIGELVCTGLNNLAMPFIRYRVGDTAVPKDGVCSCGRGGKLVERITGRTEDVVVTPDGRYLGRLDFVFKGLLNVEEAQLIQETHDHLRVRIVQRPGYTEQDTARILSNLEERLGTDIKVTLEPVERIPRTASGKFRYVISKVPLDLAGAKQAGEVLGLAAEEDRTL
jgi:phenylacetate-CoA ligase